MRSLATRSGTAALASGEFPYADASPHARRRMSAAPDRIVWGTDWPHPNVREMPDDGELVNLLAHYTDDRAALQRLLVDNPTRLNWAA
jgi:2-pyrone-4,6-dicarboxylate lactonase